MNDQPQRHGRCLSTRWSRRTRKLRRGGAVHGGTLTTTSLIQGHARLWSAQAADTLRLLQLGALPHRRRTPQLYDYRMTAPGCGRTSSAADGGAVDNSRAMAGRGVRLGYFRELLPTSSWWRGTVRVRASGVGWVSSSTSTGRRRPTGAFRSWQSSAKVGRLDRDMAVFTRPDGTVGAHHPAVADVRASGSRASPVIACSATIQARSMSGNSCPSSRLAVPPGSPAGRRCSGHSSA